MQASTLLLSTSTILTLTIYPIKTAPFFLFNNLTSLILLMVIERLTMIWINNDLYHDLY